MKYKFLPHTADIKFKAFGKTLNQAFENAALAVTEHLAKEQKIKPTKTKTIKLEGYDQKSLLYNFLEEIVYLLDAENFLTSKVKVTIKENKIEAVFHGDKASNYEVNHIKAATYAEMQIKKSKKGFEVRAVMDV